MGVAVIANRPFAKASLFGRVRGKALPEWAKEFDCESWAQFFLKYIVSHPAITCVIPATSKPGHARDNLKAGYGRMPDEATRGKMVEYMARLYVLSHWFGRNRTRIDLMLRSNPRRCTEAWSRGSGDATSKCAKNAIPVRLHPLPGHIPETGPLLRRAGALVPVRPEADFADFRTTSGCLRRAQLSILACHTYPTINGTGH
jgi:hypothetical protein